MRKRVSKMILSTALYELCTSMANGGGSGGGGGGDSDPTYAESTKRKRKNDAKHPDKCNVKLIFAIAGFEITDEEINYIIGF